MAVKYFILMVHSLFFVNLNECSKNPDTTKITVVGTAIVIKSHAAVRTDDSLLYYLDGISNWDEKYIGKRVKVTGKVVIREDPFGLRSTNPNITARPQPRLRDGIYIKKAKWRLVK
jgi:hypothetical protein